jgi:hypothetical protein
MEIIIIFNSKKYNLNIKKYESVNSIINSFLEKYNFKDNESQNYFLDYNGQYLNSNYCLEKYDITINSQLTLNKKIKGGNSFFSFFFKNPYLVIFFMIIALLPIFILPTGFVPSLSSLLDIIIKKSVDTISNYLVCVLGKKTLVSRFNLVLIFIKYIIFFLMIYVIITFPLILLCCTIKGYSIMDDPQSICSPLKTANSAGMILTIIYIFIYGFYRIGDYFINFFISIFDKFYILNMLFNPILKFTLNIFNKFKYLPLISIPFIGQGIASYFIFLSSVPEVLEMILSGVTKLGCNTNFSLSSFKKVMSKKINKSNEANISNTNNQNNNSILPNVSDGMCMKDMTECCNPNNFLKIADSLKYIIENQSISNILKSKSLFSSFVLFTEGFYEYAMNEYNSVNEIPKEMNKKINFFKSILNNDSDKLSDYTINLINNFIKTLNINLIPEIKTQLNNELPTDDSKIESIKNKISELNELMIQYSQENGISYTPGKSILKSVLKNIFLNTFCNISQTAKTTDDIINKMGDVENITDMLKAGTSSGLITSLSYFISVIILIIMGIFNIF